MEISEYAKICMNVPKSDWLAFVLFPQCNPSSIWMLGYLFQSLYKTKSNILKNYEAAFLKTQNLIFSIVAGSIWFVFCFRLKSFSRFQTTLFTYVPISKNIILSPQKALWTRIKLLQKVENYNAKVKKNVTSPRLFRSLHSLFLAAQLFYVSWRLELKLQWSPVFKCQNYRVDWLPNQKLFHHYHHAKIIQPICSIHQVIFNIQLI